VEEQLNTPCSRHLLAPFYRSNSSGLSATRRKKVGQKLVKSWSKDGQKMDKSWTKMGRFWGIFEGFWGLF